MEDFLKHATEKLIEYWFLIIAVVVTFGMAMMRTKQQTGKVSWLESGICGTFTVSVWFILSWLNLPEGFAVFVGAVLGFKGTPFISSIINKHTGMENKEGKDNE